ncbi:MAG: pilus assembly protein PilN [Gammaproteobacteria bacterium]|nr:PilN domain-containing protein [Gammaproteobacteria bacterium]NNM00598.1 pilus assembly protein PilN [Gammaproteobacteria bacterium]
MAHINLLPWREERRNQQRSEYLTVIGIVAAIAVGVVMLVNFYFNERIEYQTLRNNYLDQQIALLEKKIEEIRELERERERLIARIRAVETLQTSRPLIVHLFDELVTTLPEGVYLKEVSQQGNKVTIRGYAQSNARVSSLMRKVEESDWVTNPVLDVIMTTSEDGRRIADFTLQVEQVIPQPDEEGSA